MKSQICALPLAGLLLLASLTGCGKPAGSPSKDKAAAPAKVENGGIKETELSTIKLTAKAEERLGIQTATVESGSATQSRTVAGEVVIPPGQTLVISAPVAGTIEAVDKTGLRAGAGINQGQLLFRLQPLVAAQRDLKVSAQADFKSARIRMDAAAARTTRAEQMLKDGTGSVRALEDARQELHLAQTAVKTAEAKIEQLDRAPLDADVAMSIHAPLTGIIRQIYVTVTQQVAAGASLVEVVQLDPIWIRVPVYAGDLENYVRRTTAHVSLLGREGNGWIAKSVAAPPSADPLAATVDLYFELANRERSLRPGQKVNVTLPLRGRQQALQVPKSSILYDMHGGTWLYENTSAHTFVRRRVEVAEMQSSMAILRAGPAAGSRVVVVGAAELFGTEFGVGK